MNVQNHEQLNRPFKVMNSSEALLPKEKLIIFLCLQVFKKLFWLNKFCPICGLRFPKYPHTLISYLLVFCQIPCLNGGRCIGQNECWCPSNATGKFCHLPTPTPSKPSQGRQPNSNRVQNGSSHTVYTLPLSNQQGKGRTIMVPMWRCLLHTDTS